LLIFVFPLKMIKPLQRLKIWNYRTPKKRGDI